jgi:hypothetical protein
MDYLNVRDYRLSDRGRKLGNYSPLNTVASFGYSGGNAFE